MRKRKDMLDDISGERFGNLIVIGDTGKLNSSNRRIFIARHVETGAIIETTYTNLKNGVTTGLKSNEKYQEYITKIVTNARNNLTEKEERKRTIKSIISNYKKRKGYYFDNNRKKFCSSIQINGKKQHLGYFNTEQEAIQARQKAVDEQIKILKQELERL